jgi:hypothetical protein
MYPDKVPTKKLEADFCWLCLTVQFWSTRIQEDYSTCFTCHHCLRGCYKITCGHYSSNLIHLVVYNLFKTQKIDMLKG